MTTTKVQIHCVFEIVGVRRPKNIVFQLLYCYDSPKTLCFRNCRSTTGQIQCVYANVVVLQGK